MKLSAKYWQSSIAVVIVVTAFIMASPMAFAHDRNPGVVPINGRVDGKTYGQWSARWWQWALQLTTPTGFNNCPNESGKVWFLGAPAQTNCIIPSGKFIMFPTFNAEWSALEAQAQEMSSGGKTSCLVHTRLFGTSFAALRECVSAQADYALRPGAALEADVDGEVLLNLTHFRAQSPPPPFKFSAATGNLFGVPTGPNSAVADGYWIILKPLSPGKHLLHFASIVPFLKNLNPPNTPFLFTTAATYCLVVQPSNQTCP